MGKQILNWVQIILYLFTFLHYFIKIINYFSEKLKLIIINLRLFSFQAMIPDLLKEIKVVLIGDSGKT